MHVTTLSLPRIHPLEHMQAFRSMFMLTIRALNALAGTDYTDKASSVSHSD
jgi:hypothetical protein